MNKLIILAVAGLLSPFFAKAQLGPLMKKYHGKDCITVTQLDKNVYGLYKKKNLPAEAEDMLQQQLKEINILTLNTETCNSDLLGEIDNKFKTQLESGGKDKIPYKLIKSYKDEENRQLIYSRNSKNGLSDFVVWNQTPERLDIIELRGDIQVENIAMLSRALNIKGLNSLSSLNAANETSSDSKFAFDSEYMSELSERLREMSERLQQKSLHFNLPQFRYNLDQLMDSIGTGFSMMGNAFGQLGNSFEEMEDRSESFGSSIIVTDENGKKKIKISTRNTTPVYIVDGSEIEQTQLDPNNIKQIRVVRSSQDFKKSYIFIRSGSPVGEFISYKNNMLTFRYKNQDYKFNLEKTQHPILSINEKLTYDFNISPKKILQIRPISKAEKESGMYEGAEVIIYTK